MRFTYAEPQKVEGAAPKEKQKADPSQTSMDALRAGLAAPPPPDGGDKLAEAMRAKMERVVGGDLSAFSRYSETAVGANGFRTGAMAAGPQSAVPTQAISSASAAAAAGPMQAKKYKDHELADYGNAFQRYQNVISGQNPESQDEANEISNNEDNPSEPHEELIDGSNHTSIDLQQSLDTNDAGEQNAAEQPLVPQQTAQSADTRQANASGGGGAEDINLLKTMLTPTSLSANLLSKGTHLTGAMLEAKEFHESVEQVMKDSQADNDWFFNAGDMGAKVLNIGSGLMSGLVGMGTGIYNTVKSGQNVAEAGASVLDPITSGADTLSSMGSGASSGVELAKYLGESVGDALPILSIITGGISFGTGLTQAIRGGSALHTLKNSIASLEGTDENSRSEDQKKLLKIFNQGKRVSERNRTSGVMKTISGGLGVTTGALALSGVGSVASLATGAAGAAVGLTNFIYEKVKNRNLRKDVVNEELGNIQAVKDWWENTHPDEEALSDKQARAILMKSKGYANEKDAFQKITLQRAQDLYDIATREEDSGQPSAEKKMAMEAINALGIDVNKAEDKEKVVRLLAKKLS